jgi:hypothetical protein
VLWEIVLDYLCDSLFIKVCFCPPSPKKTNITCNFSLYLIRGKSKERKITQGGWGKGGKILDLAFFEIKILEILYFLKSSVEIITTSFSKNRQGKFFTVLDTYFPPNSNDLNPCEFFFEKSKISGPHFLCFL